MTRTALAIRSSALRIAETREAEDPMVLVFRDLGPQLAPERMKTLGTRDELLALAEQRCAEISDAARLCWAIQQPAIVIDHRCSSWLDDHELFLLATAITRRLYDDTPIEPRLVTKVRRRVETAIETERGGGPPSVLLAIMYLAQAETTDPRACARSFLRELEGYIQEAVHEYFALDATREEEVRSLLYRVALRNVLEAADIIERGHYLPRRVKRRARRSSLKLRAP